jgi:hypothetical protein
VHFVNTERSNKVVIYFESSSICVSPGFGGLTGDIPAVRPAASGGQTGGRKAVRPATSTGMAGDLRVVGPIDLYRSNRRHRCGQTGRTTSVRPISVEFKGNFCFY